MYKCALLIGVVLLTSIGAAAQDNPKVDLFGGYSFLRVSPGNGAQSVNFNGGVGSISYNVNDWLAGVGEVGGYHNGSVNGSGVSANVISYLFGPKIYKSVGKIPPFAQVLFGGARVSASGESTTVSSNAFALAPGAGLDWNVHPHIAVRLAQMDYVMTRFSNNSDFGNNSTQNSFRYSTGIVFRF